MFNDIIIYKNNIISNLKQVKAENRNSKICAMVKANAYGIGAEQVVQTIDEYVDFYGVACFFEAEKIKNLTKRPILIVGALEENYIDTKYSYSCSSLEDVEFLARTQLSIKVHLKVNTGMNRFGFKEIKEFKKALLVIIKSNLILEGVFTHFATNDQFVETQMRQFNKFIKICRGFKLNPLIHADNSFVNDKQNHHLDMVRIGFSLYNRSDGWFLHAHEIKSRIVNIQNVKRGELVGYSYRCVAKSNMRVAIIPVGYADGFSTNLCGMKLKVRGAECEVLNVCMDCFMLNITNSNLKKGDEVFLLNKFNSLKDYADYLNVSEYEISTNFSHMRATRVVI